MGQDITLDAMSTNVSHKVSNLEFHYTYLSADVIKKLDPEDAKNVALPEHRRIPQAKFFYNLDPLVVTYTQNRRKWYDVMTSVISLIGGSYLVLMQANAFFVKTGFGGPTVTLD